MNKNEFENYDFGKVIYDTSTRMYHCGLNTFKKSVKRSKSVS